MKSPSRVIVVPDDARVIRARQVRWAVAAHGVRGAARELGLNSSYVSRIVRGERARGRAS